MAKEKGKKLKIERIHIRCTPKQKKIYLDNGGSILLTKVLDEIAKKLEDEQGIK
jgi:hypothetical protein